MTTETTKPPAELIVITRARLAFARLHKAEQSRNAKGEPQGTAKFSCTLLLDPSNVEHQKQIADEFLRIIGKADADVN